MIARLSSRVVLGALAAITGLFMLSACDRGPTDMPPPKASEPARDRTSPPSPAPATPMPGAPSTAPGAPPASDPAAPVAPAAPAPGGTTQ